MATVKTGSAELGKADSFDVWVVYAAKLQASISIQVDKTGKISIMYAGNVDVKQVTEE